VVPLHASIQERCRSVGFDNLAPIIWHKIANAAHEVERGTGAFLGKPYDGDVDVAPAVRGAAGVRTEEVSLQDFRPGLQCARQALHERPVDLPGLHVCIMRHRRGAVQGGSGGARATEENQPDAGFWIGEDSFVLTGGSAR
jgi:hypothetical protein